MGSTLQNPHADTWRENNLMPTTIQDLDNRCTDLADLKLAAREYYDQLRLINSEDLFAIDRNMNAGNALRMRDRIIETCNRIILRHQLRITDLETHDEVKAALERVEAGTGTREDAELLARTLREYRAEEPEVTA